MIDYYRRDRAEGVSPPDLFSCRNCIHDAGQSLHLGRGGGYCLKHSSVLETPEDTTCKYHHRKDLPAFVVDEARSEHAAQFARFPGMVRLSDETPRSKVPYSERTAWDHRDFDPVTNTLASYYKVAPRWAFIQSFAGSIDGRRALVHGCLARRYLDHCDTWTSSYRLVLALVSELRLSRTFAPADLRPDEAVDQEATEEEARWDVFFALLAGLQEYGWHAGLEQLMWASDSLNGSLSSLDWAGVQRELGDACDRWTEAMIEHARDNDAYFTQQGVDDDEAEP